MDTRAVVGLRAWLGEMPSWSGTETRTTLYANKIRYLRIPMHKVVSYLFQDSENKLPLSNCFDNPKSFQHVTHYCGGMAMKLIFVNDLIAGVVLCFCADRLEL